MTAPHKPGLDEPRSDGPSSDEVLRQMGAPDPLEEAGAQAARSEERERLIGALIHDLRNPLNIILTWTYLLREGNLDAVTTSRALDTVRRSAERQARMLTAFVGYTRTGEDDFALDRRPIELGALVSTEIHAVRRQAEEKPIHFNLDLESGACPVLADQEWLGRALRGLMEQAIDETPAAGRVDVVLRCADAMAGFEVRRTGEMLTAEELAHPFEAIGSSNRSRGRGNLQLDLALSARVARLHGGGLVATNVPAADATTSPGASYLLTLPLLSATD